MAALVKSNTKPGIAVPGLPPGGGCRCLIAGVALTWQFQSERSPRGRLTM